MYLRARARSSARPSPRRAHPRALVPRCVYVRTRTPSTIAAVPLLVHAQVLPSLVQVVDDPLHHIRVLPVRPRATFPRRQRGPRGARGSVGEDGGQARRRRGKRGPRRTRHGWIDAMETLRCG